MGRIRLQWSRIWQILGEHFNLVGCSRVQVSHFRNYFFLRSDFFSDTEPVQDLIESGKNGSFVVRQKISY
jgi:hypothetical protein